jgi:protein tyrosine/serine phosphatase
MCQALARAACLLTPLFIAGCGLGEADDYAPLTITDNFRIIADGQAYRCAQLDPSTLKAVAADYHIRTIINLRGENDTNCWYQRERAAAQALGVTLVDIPLSAHRLPTRENLLRLYDTFKSADGPILIHCKGGADRTGAVAALWRMTVRGESRDTAARELSLFSGHFTQVSPEMDQLVRLYRPDRHWIEAEYPSP